MRAASALVLRSPTDHAGLVSGVAKVSLTMSLQVADSFHSLSAVFNVAFVITYATCQELYFQLFVSLARRSAELSGMPAKFAAGGNHS
jgi:hypothetical protein